MSYRLEGKDIVLSGMQDGIADSPYTGIADMRNINILGVPTEGSVQYKEIAATAPPALNNTAFTSDGTTNRITWAGPNTLYNGCAISFSFPGNEVDVLVVGGGGGGGIGSSGGGGGGAGDFVEDTLSLQPGTYAITVGAGGAGGGDAGGGSGDDGVNGSDSSFTDLVVAIGGGYGGGVPSTPPLRPGGDGASGGGSGSYNASAPPPVLAGGTATGVNGNNGGTGAQNNIGGGGGGGAGAVGANASGATGGNGGAGLSSSISGAAVTYAGGGGGGNGGTGGAGGGGAGGGNGGVGTANTGGGGGGGSGLGGGNTGGAGGSGVVIISYPTGSVNATGGTITTSGGNTIHTFTTSGNFVVSNSGLTAGIVYYVRNIVGTTFQVSLAPRGSIVDLTDDSSGTFTTYQYGDQRGIAGSTDVAPVAYVVDRNATNGDMNGIYLTDNSNYIWGIFPAELSTVQLPANSLIFLGNIDGVASDSLSISGLAIWKDYIFILGLTGGGIDVAELSDLFTSGPAAEWDYDWITNSEAGSNSNNKISTLVGQDDILYYTSIDGVGSIIENAGETFDPADSGTYTQNDVALAIPSFDRSTCLAELGVNLLVGGKNSFVYPWDRVSTSFTYPIVVPENYIANIVGTNQNAYVFAGNRGRIFITNGSAIDEFKKVPDYTTGVMNPYYRWRDASFSRNQLYFSFNATTNADVALTSVNAAWAVDLGKSALYVVNKTTQSGYSGSSSMVVEMPPRNVADQPSGSSLVIGWRNSNTYGVDVGSTAPYDALESFIEFDMVPVGTFLNPFSPSQIEWKTAAPLGGNGTAETIRVLYRKNITDSFTQVGSTTIATAPTEDAQNVSDMYQVNFQKAQWVQLRVEMSSNATTPTFNRLMEVRIREWEPPVS